jgi:hypothetical protein
LKFTVEHNLTADSEYNDSLTLSYYNKTVNNEYYLIIKDLKKREFNVKIKLNQNNTLFYVTWNSDDDKKIIEYKNTILAEHTIT